MLDNFPFFLSQLDILSKIINSKDTKDTNLLYYNFGEDNRVVCFQTLFKIY